MALITLDFETYYDKDYTLNKLTTEEYIRDPRFEPLIISLRTPSGDFITQDLHDLTPRQGRDFFHDHRVHEHGMLAQNTAFDGAILNWHYGVRPTSYFDIMLMSRACLRHKTGSVSLSAQAEYLGVGTKGTEVVDAIGKHREHFTDEQWQAYRDYCANDVALTYLIFTLLVKSLPPREYNVIDQTLRWYCEPLLELDAQYITKTVGEEQLVMQQHLDRAGVTMETLSSQPKFKAWLEGMGVHVPSKTSPTTGKPIPALAKSDPQFQALLEHSNPTVAAVCKARVQAKSRLKETRLARLNGISQRNGGRLPVPLLYSGAHTHRYAGDERVNLQNLPLEIRRAIKAPPGYRLMSADQGQIEARLNAALAGQWDLLEGFRNGEDVYSDMASSIYGVPVTGESEPVKRKTGKAIILGAGYGMGGERCYDFLTGQWGIRDINKAFAQQCINTYRARMGNIVENWKTVNGLLQVLVAGGEVPYGPVVFEHEAVRLPSGMRLHYRNIQADAEGYTYERYNRKTRRWAPVRIYGAMMVENICQALARELLCEQMVMLGKRWRTVHQLHDEIWFLVPDNEVELAPAVAKKVMETPPSWLPNLPLKVEPSVAVYANELK